MVEARVEGGPAGGGVRVEGARGQEVSRRGLKVGLEVERH